jgi:hypothetical protein
MVIVIAFVLRGILPACILPRTHVGLPLPPSPACRYYNTKFLQLLGSSAPSGVQQGGKGANPPPQPKAQARQ